MVASSSSSGATRAAAKNSMTARTSPAPRTGKAKAERRPAPSAARERGSGRGCSAASAIHAGRPVCHTSPGRPWPAASVTERLVSAKAATAAAPLSQVCAQRSAEPSGVGRRPQGAEVPRQCLADGGQQARMGLVLVRRRGQHTRDGVLRAQEHGDVGSLVARGHGRRQRVRRASHTRWASAPARFADRPCRNAWSLASSGRVGDGRVLACPPRRRPRLPSFMYVETDVPEGMSLDAWRRRGNARRSRPSRLVRLWRAIAG